MNLVPETNVDLMLQRHEREANNATHVDLRLGTPTTGLHSWAIPKAKLPELKEKLLAVQTKVHPYSYGTFSGKLERGRARGQVDFLTKAKAKILKVKPDRIVFKATINDKPAVYSLIRTKNKRNWILRRSKSAG